MSHLGKGVEKKKVKTTNVVVVGNGQEVDNASI